MILGFSPFFRHFSWLWLTGALRCLCPEAGKKWETSLSLWLPTSESCSDAAAGALPHMKLCASVFLPPAPQICSLPCFSSALWPYYLLIVGSSPGNRAHRRDALQNSIKSIRKHSKTPFRLKLETRCAEVVGNAKLLGFAEPTFRADQA